MSIYTKKYIIIFYYILNLMKIHQGSDHSLLILLFLFSITRLGYGAVLVAIYYDWSAKNSSY
jgi:hypothetical protein